MTEPLFLPETPLKELALTIVRRLQDAGFEAVWAGGCVRDALRGVAPQDYDVATSAHPDQITDLFGRRNTLSVGEKFGVIVVRGTRRCPGHVEVATFRADGPYSDGRRPDSVVFCTAEQDARRRDFTINGMFYDPVREKILDYVDGRADLKRRTVRAIGDPDARIAEDKLRMLRAVRFASRFDFSIEQATEAAIRRHAGDLEQVSVERIAQELRRMFAHRSRYTAFRLLKTAGLLPVIFPELSEPADPPTDSAAEKLLPKLREERFEPSLAVLLMRQSSADAQTLRERTAGIGRICRRLRLSREETATICWLADALQRIRHAQTMPLHELKPLLTDSRWPLLQDLAEAAAGTPLMSEQTAAFIISYRNRTPAERLDPAPLVSGDDLRHLSLRPGPEFGRILHQLRTEQLDERLTTRDEALRRARELAAE